MITHVVMWTLKDRSPEHVAHCKALLDALPPKIPEIRSFEVGVDVLKSGRSWDFVLIATFDDLDALERYRVHPDHAKVSDYISRALEKVGAVDYAS